MFDFKGLTDGSPVSEWQNRTKGFHMDVDAANVILMDGTANLEFEVGDFSFKSEADTIGTRYERVQARKFTLLPYGGFDGWDIFRKRRTNTDDYSAIGAKGQLGTVTGNFRAYVSPQGTEGITSDYYAYLSAYEVLANRELIPSELIATPGIDSTFNTNLVEEVIDIVENQRCYGFYVFSTLDTDESGALLNAADVANQLDGLFDTAYAATYFPWGQFYDEISNRLVYIPATAEIFRIMASTDKLVAPWAAPAGQPRGLTQFNRVRTRLSESQRDSLYEGRVNPIAVLQTPNGLGVSPYVFGQKTMLIDRGGIERSTNRINVVRLTLYLQREVRRVANQLLFEQNTIETRNRFTNLVTPILQNVRERQGIDDFRVTIDSSNDALNSNEMRVRIEVKPYRALEFIYVNFTLSNIGVEFLT